MSARARAFPLRLPASVLASLLTVLGVIYVAAPSALGSAGQSTATAPQQLVRSYPLGTQRLCCNGASGVHRAAGSRAARARSAKRLPAATHQAGSPNLVPVVLAGLLAVLLLVTAAHTLAGARRRRLGLAVSGPGAETPPRATVSFARAGEYGRADQVDEAAGSFNLGVALHERGELEEAREAYQRAERRGDPDAGFNLGVLLYEAGDLRGAEDAWRRCAARGHRQAAANLRFLLQTLGDPTTSELDHRRADQAGETGGSFNLGVALHERGELEEAREAYQRAERRGDPDAGFNLGVLLYEAGDLRGAEDAWRRCAARGHRQAAANLRFLLQTGHGPTRAPEAATALRVTEHKP